MSRPFVAREQCFYRGDKNICKKSEMAPVTYRRGDKVIELEPLLMSRYGKCQAVEIGQVGRCIAEHESQRRKINEGEENRNQP